MCTQQVVEDVSHFVMDCPAYAHRRFKLFSSVSRAIKCTSGNADFDAISKDNKMHIILGKRTGNADTDKNIDRMVKQFLKKNWNLRQPVTSAINSTLNVDYGIMVRAR